MSIAAMLGVEVRMAPIGFMVQPFVAVAMARPIMVFEMFGMPL
jgi:hypothetical protein